MRLQHPREQVLAQIACFDLVAVRCQGALCGDLCYITRQNIDGFEGFDHLPTGCALCDCKPNARIALANHPEIGLRCCVLSGGKTGNFRIAVRHRIQFPHQNRAACDPHAIDHLRATGIAATGGDLICNFRHRRARRDQETTSFEAARSIGIIGSDIEQFFASNRALIPQINGNFLHRAAGLDFEADGFC